MADEKKHFKTYNDRLKRDNVGVEVAKNRSKKQYAPTLMDVVHDKSSFEDYMPGLRSSEIEGRRLFPTSEFFITCSNSQDYLIREITKTIRSIASKCPTPTYGQDVWHCKVNEPCVMLWSIPPRIYIKPIYDNRMVIDPFIKDMTQHVVNFVEGDYDRLCMKLNKEDILTSNVKLEILNG